MTDSRDTQRWAWRGAFVVVLALGWAFIAWQNHFHLSSPLIFACLGYLAVISTVANLWRTGASAVAADDHENDSTWAQPAGALGELEREKRTLLKAIKEAEFDHQMGKLSQLDVDNMIRMYRARAIEVIKEIDRLQSGATGTPREQIMREVRARLELEARSQKKTDVKAAAADANGAAEVAATVEATTEAAAAGVANGATAEAVEAAAPGAASGTSAATAEASDAAPATKADAKAARADAKAKKKAAAKVDAKSAASLDDEGLDADSTTTVEPKRNDPAKEATP